VFLDTTKFPYKSKKKFKLNPNLDQLLEGGIMNFEFR